jgi:hypothetical protein
LFLDLLGKALAEQKAQDADIVTTSGDGSLQISMKRTEDNAIATIVTSDGDFHGHDYYLSIIDLTCVDPVPGDNHDIARDVPVKDVLYQTAGG